MARRLLLLVLVGSLIAAVGCGGSGGGGGGSSLTAAEQLTVATFNSDVAGTVLDSSSYGALLDSKDQMIALVRAKPDAIYQTEAGEVLGETYPAESKTLRQVLADAASSLEPYRPELADEFDRVLNTLE